MRPSLKLSFIALLALGLGVAYASPMFVTPMNIQPFPRVPEGPKADFSVDIVYASFNPVEWQCTTTEYDETGSFITKTYSATNVTYNVVLNVTNLSDQPATIYEFAFTAAKDISVEQSILGGTLYDRGSIEGLAENKQVSHFGGIVDGVYLDGNWVNVTWIPEGRWIDGKWNPMPYPQCLLALTQVYWNEQEGFFPGPLTPDDIAAFSADYTLNSAIPDLPANASEIGIWFEGVPITEYYDRTGNPLVTVMYINGSWVDVTGRVTVDKTQPFMVASNMLVNDVLTVGAQPYENWGNTTVGPITALPSWSGGIGVGRTYSWLPFSYPKGFNNTWAQGESRLIMFNNTQMFIFSLGNSRSGLDALQTGNIKLYASVSNYIDNWPVNGTYYNTASTAVQVAQLQLEKTPNGYVYNAVLADNQMFQLGNSGIEVTIVPRIEQ